MRGRKTMKIQMITCIKEAAGLLGLTAVAADPAGALGEEETADRDLLLKCVNLAAQQTALKVSPPRFEETVAVTGSELELGQLSRRALQVLEVRDGQGHKVPFEHLPYGIRLKGPGSYQVCYTYLPDDAALDEALVFDEGRVHAELLGMGAAAEYCLIAGRFSEAAAWEEEFLNRLSGLGQRRRLPRRAFALS